jgi:hypothetical protein
VTSTRAPRHQPSPAAEAWVPSRPFRQPDAAGRAGGLSCFLASLNLTVTARGRQPPGAWERRRKPQINHLFCKPICKPDKARQFETGETEPTERDPICHVRRCHRTRERLPETAETRVVWLITQRSRVQIPPPLPRPEAGSRTENRPSARSLCTGCAVILLDTDRLCRAPQAGQPFL